MYINSVDQLVCCGYHSPSDLRTVLWAISLNFARSSRHVFAASTLAALSSFGSAHNTTKHFGKLISEPAIWMESYKWKCPILTPARWAGTRLTYPRGMKGWVDLGVGCTRWPEIEKIPRVFEVFTRPSWRPPMVLETKTNSSYFMHIQSVMQCTEVLGIHKMFNILKFISSVYFRT